MTPNLGDLPIDVTRLLESRMLIQSNSGGGKSHALRRVLEQTAPTVQQIVIDPEGEFASLREKFDYIICAPTGGDALATTATAAALARAVWESGVSAIIDIYELKAHDRIAFVRRFVDALVNAPKSIWHPTLVVIDEVHIFAPQVGQAESLGAVTDLATRGRKRGLSLLGATQRLAKLHKDVAAELLNKLIGRTGLDVDVARAADELGLPLRDARTVLRELEPGQFFAYGPALSRAVVRTTIGPVQTTHPQSGQRMMTAPPPASVALMKKLATLAGLQRAAADEAQTVEGLRAELAKATAQIATLSKGAGVPEAEVRRRISEAVLAASAKPQTPPDPPMKALTAAVAKIRAGLELLQAELPGSAAPAPAAAPAPRAPRAAPSPAAPTTQGGTPEQRVLDAIAWWAVAGVHEPSRHQVAFVAGYKVTGHFNNIAGTLRSRGLIDYPSGGALGLTDAGMQQAKQPGRAPTRAELVERVRGILKGEPQQRAFMTLDNAGRPMSREDLASACGYTVNGHFNNIVGALNGIGVVDYPQRGYVALSSIFDKIGGAA